MSRPDYPLAPGDKLVKRSSLEDVQMGLKTLLTIWSVEGTFEVNNIKHIRLKSDLDRSSRLISSTAINLHYERLDKRIL